MNPFARIVLQIAIHSFIHLLANEYILNTDYEPGSAPSTEQMDKNPCLHVAYILVGWAGHAE